MERSGRVLTISAVVLVAAGGGLAMLRDGGAESSDVVDASDVAIGRLTARATLEVQPDSEGTTGQGWRLCLHDVPVGSGASRSETAEISMSVSTRSRVMAWH